MNMDDSYTIIRRFTPPTCTLEIWGKNSPLSRWAKKTVVKDVQFKLSFDDPRMVEEEAIAIAGNQDKLEQIYNVVLSYTESFLEQSFTQKLSDDFLEKQHRAIDSNQPYLIPQKLTDHSLESKSVFVNHQFHLGSLSPQQSNVIIPLSATQLFDLVSALEEYKTEMAVLAELEAEEIKKTAKKFPIGISVAGILLAAGLTTLVVKEFANQSNPKEQVATNNQTTKSSTTTNNSVEDVISPDINEEKPATKIEENSELSSLEKLPPPPSVDTPKPQPDIPDPALYPPSGNLQIPPLASIPEQNNQLKEVQPQSATNNSQVESTITIPAETAPTNTSEETQQDSTEKETIPKSNQGEKNDTNSSETTIKSEASGNSSSVEIPTESDRENNSSDEIINPNSEVTDNNIALNNSVVKSNSEPIDNTESESESTIPQIKQIEEIENYFQQKWRSQAELKQTLEYRLMLNQNGSIQRIIPIGKASEIYLDRTNIPLMGEPFVSPLNKSNVTIRLLLSPDGEVRTFLE